MKDLDISQWLILFLILIVIGSVIKEFGWLGVLYLLILGILVMGTFSETYRKFIGTTLGFALLALLFSLIYMVLKKNQSFVLFLHSTRVISLFGLWLTAIGFIGKSRLEKWDSNIKNLLHNRQSDETAEFITVNVIRGMIRIVMGGLMLSAIVGVFIIFARPLLSAGLSILSVSPNRENYVLGIIFFTPIVLFFSFGFLIIYIGYALLIPLQILLFPFRLAYVLDKTNTLERGFVIVGLLLSTIGLILNY